LQKNPIKSLSIEEQRIIAEIKAERQAQRTVAEQHERATVFEQLKTVNSPTVAGRNIFYNCNVQIGEHNEQNVNSRDGASTSSDQESGDEDGGSYEVVVEPSTPSSDSSCHCSSSQQDIQLSSSRCDGSIQQEIHASLGVHLRESSAVSHPDHTEPKQVETVDSVNHYQRLSSTPSLDQASTSPPCGLNSPREELWRAMETSLRDPDVDDSMTAVKELSEYPCYAQVSFEQEDPDDSMTAVKELLESPCYVNEQVSCEPDSASNEPDHGFREELNDALSESDNGIGEAWNDSAAVGLSSDAAIDCNKGGAPIHSRDVEMAVTTCNSHAVSLPTMTTNTVSNSILVHNTDADQNTEIPVSSELMNVRPLRRSRHSSEEYVSPYRQRVLLVFEWFIKGAWVYTKYT